MFLALAKIQKVIGLVTVVAGVAVAVYTAWSKIKALRAAAAVEEVKAQPETEKGT